MITIARGQAPVLWTLHDMWALGDSSESYWQEDQIVEGGRWKGARVEELRGLGVEGLRRSRVKKVCREPGKYPVRLTAPSQWLAGLAKEITGEEGVYLPNPIDLEIYSPGDRTEARRQLGLPRDGLVVLAGADSLRDRRKGFDLLREAWSRLPHGCTTLAMFGRHGEQRPGERYLGNLTLDEEMVAAYRAADLYLHPARMENAPCTIQESLACGTPVVAFPVGGIPEMIEPGKTGFLASRVSAEALQKEWGSALASPARLSEMRERCRKAAEEIWGPDALGKRFLGVIEGLRG
jgi:glycosyltransferase involved in cell wall biosynthesis